MSYKLGKKINLHPGEVLKDVVKQQRNTQTQLAKAIDISQPDISDVINGRWDMATTLAYKLSAAMAVAAKSWMTLQKNWEFANVSPAVATGIKKLLLRLSGLCFKLLLSVQILPQMYDSLSC